ncbi:MAG: glycosyltransferase [Peptococcaceae bacterium]|jgi:glycosyltransferase involved in cell wall biosynthesis|nr:glycosyltransferase [Peptococcaceae bacterium]
MTIKVLHLIGGGEIAGAEKHVLSLLNHLPAENVNPLLGCLLQNSPLADLVQARGLASVTFPMKFPLDLTAAIPLIRFCRESQIQLLHCHGTRASLVGRVAARILSLPCISTIHSLPEFDYKVSWKGRAALFLDYHTLSLVDAVITVSYNLKEYAVTRREQKGLTFPVKIIYNGRETLDFSERDQLRDNFRKEYGIPEHTVVLGTIGRLHPVKGQFFLIEAAQLLHKEFPDLHILLVGDGPSRTELQDVLKASGLNYTLTGYLPEAWRILPTMDIFVLPSQHEGMGLVLLEAAQAKVPIVATRVGGIPEILTDQSEALLVNPANPLDLALACSKLLNDQALAQKLVTKAAEKAKLFTPEKMATETAALYREILK